MFKRGTQVIYAPSDARDENGLIDHNHPAVRFGFVTEHKRGKALVKVRYFHNGSDELRTRRGSELTPVAGLFEYESRPQEVIEKLLRQIETNGHEMPMNI